MSRLEPFLEEEGAELEVLWWTPCEMTAVASTCPCEGGRCGKTQEVMCLCWFGNGGVEEDMRGVRDEF